MPFVVSLPTVIHVRINYAALHLLTITYKNATPNSLKQQPISLAPVSRS